MSRRETRRRHRRMRRMRLGLGIFIVGAVIGVVVLGVQAWSIEESRRPAPAHKPTVPFFLR